MEKTHLSIIIPVFNVEDFIEECLESIFKQIDNTVEVILVNDGSTDRTVEVISQLKMKPKKLHLIHQKNQGPGIARNKGAKVARGEYLFFVDADDIIPENAIRENLQKCLQYSPDILNAPMYRLRKDCLSRAKLTADINFNNSLLKGIDLNPELIRGTSPCDKFFKRRFWEDKKLYFELNHFYEELFVVAKSLIRAESIYLSSTPIYHWRIRDNGEKSTTQRRNERSYLEDRMHAIEKIEHLLIKHNKWSAHEVFLSKLFSHDIPLFMNQLPNSSIDFKKYFWNTILPFLKNYSKELRNHYAPLMLQIFLKIHDKHDYPFFLNIIECKELQRRQKYIGKVCLLWNLITKSHEFPTLITRHYFKF